MQARDELIRSANVGVNHWSAHVQAQTDANHGYISVKQMSAIFKRTRLAGPDDLAHYNQALAAAVSATGSCKAPNGAPQNVRTKMASCAERQAAQAPVLQAAANAVDDWRSHLGQMRRSRMGHVHDAQGVWIRAWRAAPPHISAYLSAKSDFHAPAC